MRPWLVLDCYVAGDGSTNFTRHLPGPCRVVRPAHALLPLDPSAFRGVVLTGSVAGVNDRLPWVSRLVHFARRALDRRVPLLGVCFGHQVLAAALAGPGAVRRSPTPEVGWYRIHQRGPAPMMAGLPQHFRTFLSHFDEVDPALRGQITVQAASARCPVQAFAVPHRPAWGLQFHAEMGPAETRRIVLHHIGTKHPGQPAVALSKAVDSTLLIQRILANFAQQAG